MSARRLARRLATVFVFEDRSGQVAAGLGRAQNRPRQGPGSSVSRVSKVRIKSARTF